MATKITIELEDEKMAELIKRLTEELDKTKIENHLLKTQIKKYQDAGAAEHRKKVLDETFSKEKEAEIAKRIKPRKEPYRNF